MKFPSLLQNVLGLSLSLLKEILVCMVEAFDFLYGQRFVLPKVSPELEQIQAYHDGYWATFVEHIFFTNVQDFA